MRSCLPNVCGMNSKTVHIWQAVHRMSPADRARCDAATEQRSSYLHAVGMMPRAFHLLRAMFATGPRVQPLEEVRCRSCVWYAPGDCRDAKAPH